MRTWVQLVPFSRNPNPCPLTYFSHHAKYKGNIVEALIPNQNPNGNLYGTRISIGLGLNLDQAKTNSAMTHFMVLNAK